MSKLTHINANGEAQMVDVSEKNVTAREARAGAKIFMQSKTLDLILSGSHSKGDVLAVARIAGIQAAKKCSELIPLCHPLMISKVSLELEPNSEKNCIESRLSGFSSTKLCVGRTSNADRARRSSP